MINLLLNSASQFNFALVLLIHKHMAPQSVSSIFLLYYYDDDYNFVVDIFDIFSSI